mmetsp:Transcript_35803/g.93699  ORF Transcript_35803/g.93699 Transcript_35803/m.93699 type:complete len:591 (-) Transcript_35803:42-1814(-)
MEAPNLTVGGGAAIGSADHHHPRPHPQTTHLTHTAAAPPAPTSVVLAPHRSHSRHAAEPMTWTLKLAASTAAIGGFLFGYDIGVISGALLQLVEEFELSDTEAEAVVSALLVGAVLASATGGYICDWIGRRNTIIANAALFILSACWLAMSTNLAMLLAARVVVGYAVSLSAIAECVYISEIAPPTRRGQLVSLNELGITVGVVVAYAVNFALIDTAGGWRVMFGVAAIPASIQALGMAQLPKSPRWLLMVHRRAEAMMALKKFRFASHELLTIPLVAMDGDGVGGEGKEEGDGAESAVGAELAATEQAIAEQGETRLTDLLRVPVLRKALWICSAIVLLQQLTGQPSILVYGTVLLRQAGFKTRREASLANLAIGVMKASSTVVAMLTVDKHGRRRLLLIGTAVMVMALLVLASVLTAYTPDIVDDNNATAVPMESAGASEDEATMPEHIKWTTLGSLTAYVCAFSFSYGPIGWLLLSETFPDSIRARAMAVATLLNYGVNFAVTASFLTLLSAIGFGGLCFIFASIGVVGACFIYTRVPETKGASLEQIQAILLAAEPPCACCPGASATGASSYRRLDVGDYAIGEEV